ncbi:Cytosolic carboxypeptidase 6 [Collichthys lucidus]|uniref:Cytosolic carboxypeptidase 6 n=1 Tax=Collichthys lucidus TaxID=240159 RepID=A0A4U5UK08_COLLU|nr:Cytosolic carboxypeptidase 6 [Collichthys lucidus]
MGRGEAQGERLQSSYGSAVVPQAWSYSRNLSRQRLPAKNVYYYRCPDHRRNYVMSFAFCFDREDDVYQFAYCYPYTYSRLQHYLASLERRNLPYLQREQLGLSVVSSEVGLVSSKSFEESLLASHPSLGKGSDSSPYPRLSPYDPGQQLGTPGGPGEPR